MVKINKENERRKKAKENIAVKTATERRKSG